MKCYKEGKMKIQYLEQIIARIQDEIHCPKCKNVFKKENIEVNSVYKNRIEFATHCHICGAQSQISANIGVLPLPQSNVSNSISKMKLPKKNENINEGSKLGFDSVHQIFDDLARFKGTDIRTLFDKSEEK